MPAARGDVRRPRPVTRDRSLAYTTTKVRQAHRETVRRAPGGAAGTPRAKSSAEALSPSAGRGAELEPSCAGAVTALQRARLLDAALRALDEAGYGAVTVGDVTARARVSRRTFYELFAGREECLLAALESVTERIARELAALDVENLPWRERTRAQLWAILSFLEREPALARACVVQALRGGPRVLARRAETLAALARELERGLDGDGHRGGARAGDRERGLEQEGRSGSPRAGEPEPPSLTAQGVVGGVFAIVYGRLLRERRAGEPAPLGDLLGELMAIVVLPYLGPAAAARERRRQAPPALPSVAPDAPDQGLAGAGGPVAGREEFLWPQGVPGPAMRLTYRTARVLDALARRPESSNRRVGELAGIADQGQVSKLLARLDRLGLVTNTSPGHGRGERNAWVLTGTGGRLARGIRAHTGNHEGGVG